VCACPQRQYADDTLRILRDDARVLFNLKGLLISFLFSTRLHVNFEKSFLVCRVLFSLKGLLRSFLDSTRLHVNFEKSFLVPTNLT